MEDLHYYRIVQQALETFARHAPWSYDRDELREALTETVNRRERTENRESKNK